jgi:hypothetical protein
MVLDGGNGSKGFGGHEVYIVPPPRGKVLHDSIGPGEAQNETSARLYSVSSSLKRINNDALSRLCSHRPKS